MKVRKGKQVLWVRAVDLLSAEAFYLLNVMWYKDMDMNDNALMEVTGLGVSTHRKYKKELIDNGYLHVKQVGKGLYRYLVGERVSNG